jgi:hypothetical protein
MLSRFYKIVMETKTDSSGWMRELFLAEPLLWWSKHCSLLILNLDPEHSKQLSREYLRSYFDKSYLTFVEDCIQI